MAVFAIQNCWVYSVAGGEGGFCTNLWAFLEEKASKKFRAYFSTRRPPRSSGPISRREGLQEVQGPFLEEKASKKLKAHFSEGLGIHRTFPVHFT